MIFIEIYFKHRLWFHTLGSFKRTNHHNIKPVGKTPCSRDELWNLSTPPTPNPQCQSAGQWARVPPVIIQPFSSQIRPGKKFWHYTVTHGSSGERYQTSPYWKGLECRGTTFSMVVPYRHHCVPFNLPGFPHVPWTLSPRIASICCAPWEQPCELK